MDIENTNVDSIPIYEQLGLQESTPLPQGIGIGYAAQSSVLQQGGIIDPGVPNDQPLVSMGDINSGARYDSLTLNEAVNNIFKRFILSEWSEMALLQSMWGISEFTPGLSPPIVADDSIFSLIRDDAQFSMDQFDDFFLQFGEWKPAPYYTSTQIIAITTKALRLLFCFDSFYSKLSKFFKSLIVVAPPIDPNLVNITRVFNFFVGKEDRFENYFQFNCGNIMSILRYFTSSTTGLQCKFKWTSSEFDAFDNLRGIIASFNGVNVESNRLINLIADSQTTDDSWSTRMRAQYSTFPIATCSKIYQIQSILNELPQLLNILKSYHNNICSVWKVFDSELGANVMWQKNEISRNITKLLMLNNDIGPMTNVPLTYYPLDRSRLSSLYWNNLFSSANKMKLSKDERQNFKAAWYSFGLAPLYHVLTRPAEKSIYNTINFNWLQAATKYNISQADLSMAFFMCVPTESNEILRYASCSDQIINIFQQNWKYDVKMLYYGPRIIEDNIYGGPDLDGGDGLPFFLEPTVAQEEANAAKTDLANEVEDTSEIPHVDQIKFVITYRFEDYARGIHDKIRSTYEQFATPFKLIGDLRDSDDRDFVDIMNQKYEKDLLEIGIYGAFDPNKFQGPATKTFIISKDIVKKLHSDFYGIAIPDAYLYYDWNNSCWYVCKPFSADEILNYLNFQNIAEKRMLNTIIGQMYEISIQNMGPEMLAQWTSLSEVQLDLYRKTVGHYQSMENSQYIPPRPKELGGPLANQLASQIAKILDYFNRSSRGNYTEAVTTFKKSMATKIEAMTVKERENVVTYGLRTRNMVITMEVEIERCRKEALFNNGYTLTQVPIPTTANDNSKNYESMERVADNPEIVTGKSYGESTLAIITKILQNIPSTMPSTVCNLKLLFQIQRMIDMIHTLDNEAEITPNHDDIYADRAQLVNALAGMYNSYRNCIMDCASESLDIFGNALSKYQDILLEPPIKSLPLTAVHHSLDMEVDKSKKAQRSIVSTAFYSDSLVQMFEERDELSLEDLGNQTIQSISKSLINIPN